MMSEGYEKGFAFLPGTAIDQHFAQRKRFADMSLLMRAHPQLLGIGIDEETALIVRGTVGEVIGNHEVHFYDGSKPRMNGELDYQSIKSGDRFDLSIRKRVGD
jgi:cyanophycinase-like exopeptidase